VISKKGLVQFKEDGFVNLKSPQIREMKNKIKLDLKDLTLLVISKSKPYTTTLRHIMMDGILFFVPTQ
jgi:hypothetical protein